MAYTKYSLTPADNNAAPPNGAPEGMLPSGVNDTMRDMMSQIRDVGDGIRGGTYTMTAPVITGGSVSGVTFSSAAATITGGSVSGVTFSSSAATITGGSVTGVTFSSSAATITGGSVSGITDLAIADGGTGASTAADARINLGVDNYGMLKNRIINGDMRINQRALGTVTVNSSVYTTDRWQANQTAAGKYSVQNSTIAPTGFTNSYLATSLSAYSVSSSDIFFFQQNIEGNNISDFAWGTASAATVTLSFRVRSSLTGTFGGALANSDHSRSYPFSYTISAADTWETKSITISGDTSGTWLTTNGIGIQVIFGLGGGASRSGTAGAWAASTLYTATGATSVVGTNGATFYITGVQLEKGTQATSFEYRQYQQELALCQRYCYVMNATDSNGANRFGLGFAQSTTRGYAQTPHPVPMRIKPSLTTTASDLALSDTAAGTTVTSISIQAVTSDVNKTSFEANVASGLTAFRPYFLEAGGTSALIILSSEL